MNPLKQFFFEQTLRHWHFEDIRKASELSRERVHFYLKELLREGFVQKIKPRRKMPFYLARYEDEAFRMQKRLYGLFMLERSGLFVHLLSLKNITTAFLFGSFARGDWNPSSDVDLFLYGDDSHFEKGLFETKLKRELQVFSFTKAKEVKKSLEPALLKNIAKGFNIKGSLEPFEVSIHA